MEVTFTQWNANFERVNFVRFEHEIPIGNSLEIPISRRIFAVTENEMRPNCVLTSVSMSWSFFVYIIPDSSFSPIVQIAIFYARFHQLEEYHLGSH